MNTRPLSKCPAAALIALLSGTAPCSGLAGPRRPAVRAGAAGSCWKKPNAPGSRRRGARGGQKAAELAREMARSSAALDREARQRESAKAPGRSSQEQAEERAAQQEEMERVAGRTEPGAPRIARGQPGDRGSAPGTGKELRRTPGRCGKSTWATARSSASCWARNRPRASTIIGVSPGGPAERAGLQAGDVLVSIRGESLAGGGREQGPRHPVPRDGRSRSRTKTIAVVVATRWRNPGLRSDRRTARTQQLADHDPDSRTPGRPEAARPRLPHIVVEGIEIPQIDDEALNARIQALNEELETRRFLFVSPDGEELSIEEEFVLPEEFDVEIDELSDLAGQALGEANMWFGLPHAQGLELAEVNEGLGAYFKTDRGVLVIKLARTTPTDSKSGDVVLDINRPPGQFTGRPDAGAARNRSGQRHRNRHQARPQGQDADASSCRRIGWATFPVHPDH